MTVAFATAALSAAVAGARGSAKVAAAAAAEVAVGYLPPSHSPSTHLRGWTTPRASITPADAVHVADPSLLP